MASDRVPTLRPLGVGDILDELFAIYRRGFKTLVGIAAIVHIPLAILSLGFIPLAVGMPQMARSMTPNAPPPDFGPMMTMGIATLVVTVPLLIVASLLELSATCYATSAIYLGETPTIGGAYRLALGRFWRLFRLALVFLAVVLGLSILAFIPAVFPPLLCISIPVVIVAASYLSVAWCLSLPALVLENLPGAMRALARSRELVRGAWWRTWVTIVVMSILVGVLQGLVGGLVGAIASIVGVLVAAGNGQPPIWITVVNSLVSSALNVLLAPLFYIGVTLLYYDRRVRAEAYDLTILARELGRQQPDATAP